jgi:hypothetical protein
LQKGTDYTILFSKFSLKSDNSTIQVVFDAEWGLMDLRRILGSSMFINNQIVTKIARFNQDETE